MGYHHRLHAGLAAERRRLLCIDASALTCYVCSGASRGIGQAIAEQMADEKANLILLAQREGALKEVMLL